MNESVVSISADGVFLEPRISVAASRSWATLKYRFPRLPGTSCDKSSPYCVNIVQIMPVLCCIVTSQQVPLVDGHNLRSDPREVDASCTVLPSLHRTRNVPYAW